MRKTFASFLGLLCIGLFTASCVNRGYNNSSLYNGSNISANASSELLKAGFSFALDPEMPQQMDAFGFDFSTVSVVGLGEATHGTSEFNPFRHMFFRYLVEKYGYRNFLLEDEWLGLRMMQESLDAGVNVNSAMSNLTKYGVWATLETASLYRWIQEFNANHRDDPIVLYGLDMQSMDAIQKGLNRLATNFPNLASISLAVSNDISRIASCLRNPDCVKTLELTTFFDAIAKARELESQGENTFKNATMGIRNDVGLVRAPAQFLMKFTRDLIDVLANMRGETWAREAYASLAKTNLLTDACKKSSYECRDEAMANNTLLALKLNPKKSIIWAHNGHVGRYKAHPEVIWWKDRASTKVSENLGSMLNRVLGSRYFSVITDFYQGRFLALDGYSGEPKEWNPPPAITDESKLQLLLNGSGRQNFAINLRSLISPDVKELFSSPQRIRLIGNFSALEEDNKESYQTAILPRYADGYVFFDSTTAHHPLFPNGLPE